VHFSSLLFYSELAVTNSNDEKHCTVFASSQMMEVQYMQCITLLPFQIWCVREKMFSPFISFSFMICCDKCDTWYHGACIDLTEEEGELLDNFYCDMCQL
jgi:hypothetical protein